MWAEYLDKSQEDLPGTREYLAGEFG